MKKIRIGLTFNTVNELISPSYDYLMALVRLKQHRIVVSDTIIQAYEDFFFQRGLQVEFSEWYRNIGRYDFVEEVDSVAQDFETEIISLLCAYDHAILVKYNESVPFDTLSVLDLEDINDTSGNNELGRQCVPTEFMLPEGSSREKFGRWLSEMLADEKRITIIDRHIMNDINNNILDDFYIPSFPSDATVEVYFGDREKNQNLINILKSKYKNRIKLHNCVSSDFHDRYIMGDSFYIVIGVGLDVFNTSEPFSRKETKITVSSDQMKPTLPKRIIIHR